MTWLRACAVVLLLTSCSSTTLINNSPVYEVNIVEQPAVTAVKAAVIEEIKYKPKPIVSSKVASKPTAVCTKITKPQLIPPPPIPFSEIERIRLNNPNDNQAIDLVLANHIKLLYSVIHKNRLIVANHQYVVDENCVPNPKSKASIKN